MLAFFKVSKFFVYAALFSVVFVNTETLFPFIVTKYVVLRIAVGLALILFLLGWLFARREESKIFETDFLNRLKSPLVIAVSLFVLIFLLAGFFGFNPHNSFWSNFERGEGGFQLLTFYVFFLLLVFLFKEKRDWRGLFKTSLVAALLMIAYGFLAAAGIKGFVGVPLEIGQRFQGSLGNTAYVGTYLLFSLFYAFYMLSGDLGKLKSRIGRIILWLLVILFLVIMWLTQTRGAFVGLAIGAVLLFLYLAAWGKGNVRKVGAFFLVAGVLLGGFLYSIRTAPIMRELGFSRFFNITFDNISTQSRFWSWQSAIESWKERPVLGWGFENYGRIFDKYFDTRHFIPNEPSDTWYDRAHNVFFDYLVAGGILGLLSYVGIFAVFFRQFWKKRDRERPVGDALVLALTVAYLFQGIVIFDVLPIYLNLFLFLAFANHKFHEPNN